MSKNYTITQDKSTTTSSYTTFNGDDCERKFTAFYTTWNKILTCPVWKQFAWRLEKSSQFLNHITRIILYADKMR